MRRFCTSPSLSAVRDNPCVFTRVWILRGRVRAQTGQLQTSRLPITGASRVDPPIARAAPGASPPMHAWAGSMNQHNRFPCAEIVKVGFNAAGLHRTADFCIRIRQLVNSVTLCTAVNDRACRIRNTSGSMTLKYIVLHAKSRYYSFRKILRTGSNVAPR